MPQRRIVIVGAGFAGAATAMFLAALGERNLVILEAEKIPGAHASGCNAAMCRQVVCEPDIASLAREGCAYIRHWARNSRPEYFQQNGSLLIESGAAAAALSAAAGEGVEAGLRMEWLTPRQSVERVRLLSGSDFDRGLYCPSDGIVDIAALLSHYLDSARRDGARIEYNARVTRIECPGGAIQAVHCGDERYECEILVNASGAWVNEIACLAGAAPLAITPYRRHLFVTGGMPGVDASMPFVWDITHDIYFRPEGGGLLLSPCDQTPHQAGTPRTENAAQLLLAEKVCRHLPHLRSCQVVHSWAGLRTIAADGRFVIGWDASVQGLFWVAALGGHGMTCSAAVGRLAAQAIAGIASGPDSFWPGRGTFAERRAT